MDKGRPHPALGLPIAAVLLLLVGPIVGATPDDEEYPKRHHQPRPACAGSA